MKLFNEFCVKVDFSEKSRKHLQDIFNFCKENNLQETCYFEKNSFKTMNLVHLVDGQLFYQNLISEINDIQNKGVHHVPVNALNNSDLKSFHIVEYEKQAFEKPNFNTNANSFTLVFPLYKGSKKLKVYKQDHVSTITVYSFKEADLFFFYPSDWVREVEKSDQETVDTVAFMNFVYNPKKKKKPIESNKKKLSLKEMLKKVYFWKD